MLTEHPSSRSPRAGAASRRSHRPRARRRPQLRRIALLAALICMLPALGSYASMLAQRSNSSLFIRTVEWVRSNGLRGLVTSVENFYYGTLAAPAKGGPAAKHAPRQVGAELASVGRALARLYYRPPAITPVVHPAVPGEGVWRAPYALDRSHPPVLITSFRPQAAYPSNFVGVAWIDHNQTSVVLYPGIQEPSVTIPNRGPEEVPPSMRSRLVATFNAGFKLVDSGGGFALDGHTYAPMKDGQGALVRYTNGRVNLINWTGGPDVPADISWATQNLPLIVDNGRPNPNLADGALWGATLGNAVLVWRSAIGIDRYGNLIYAAGNYLSAASLAQVMIHAGAVRAMELDINSYWPSFITYRYPGAKDPANLLPSMVRSPYRYLTPDDRDFFAVYLKR